MLRIGTVAACALALLASCGEDGEDAGGGAPTTKLTVTVWPDGRDRPSRTRTVECPGAEVCGGLSAGDLKPVPKLTACTAQYGGPAVARVTGTLDGDAVEARFDLTNGCEIARWKRNRDLLGAVP
jgi:hypothetical protein